MARYEQGLAERAKAAAGSARTPVPHLLAAATSYDPEKDGVMTLGQIAKAQENIRTMTDPNSNKPVLKAETIAGLQALQEQVRQQQAPTPPAPTPAPAAPAAEKPKSVTLSAEEREQLAETSDLDFDLMMNRLRSDVINNAEERKAVEGRVKPMDLSDGLVNGEWTQLVPIYPGKLEVVFRSITPLENDEIRRKLLEEILQDERLARFSGEKYGFMQLVAAVHILNGRELPRHLVGSGISRTFDWDVFRKKVDVFMVYPGPLIQAIGTHAHWFDLRVRSLFSTVALKNG